MSILLQSVPSARKQAWWPPASASVRGAHAARRRPLYLIYDGGFGECNAMEYESLNVMEWSEPSPPACERINQRIFEEVLSL